MVIKKNQERVDTLLIINLITGSKINNRLRVVCIFVIDLTYYVSTSQTNFVDFKGLLATLGIMWLNKYVDSSIVAWVFLHCCSLFFCIVAWLLLYCWLASLVLLLDPLTLLLGYSSLLVLLFNFFCVNI
jgi:hypothetical protein